MLKYPKIITIVGDSLSMNFSERNIFYRDTYPFKLQYLLDPNKYHVRPRNKGGNCVDYQAKPEHLDADILSSDSEYIIFQLGIVDCTPRLFSRLQKGIIAVLCRNPITKIFTVAFIKFKQKRRRFFTKYFPKIDVSPKVFEEKYSFILKKIKESKKTKKVFIINIADADEENKQKSYNLEKNILEYNQILKELVDKNKDFCELIDIYTPSAQKDSGLIVKGEGVHLTREGNDYLVRLLCDKIQAEERLEKSEFIGNKID